MRLKNLLFLLLCCCFMCNATGFETNSTGIRRIGVSQTGSAQNNHMMQPIDSPTVYFQSLTNTITVDFGTQPVNSFVVTISSLYTDVDYYATSSFTTIPLAPDGFSDYSIVITTAAGDVFEGILTASDYTTSEMY